MAPNEHYAAINQLLLNMNRSLMQYVGEAWPWSDAGCEAEKERLSQLIAAQQQHVQRLADFLMERNWRVDPGTYPSTYSDLHYVALDYLLSQMVENQQGLVADAEAAQRICAADAQSARLLEQTYAGEREILDELRKLTTSRAKARVG